MLFGLVVFVFGFFSSLSNFFFDEVYSSFFVEVGTLKMREWGFFDPYTRFTIFTIYSFKIWTTVSGRSDHGTLNFIMKTYVSFQVFHTTININCKKCDIASILIFSQFTPMYMPKNLESAPAKVLTHLRKQSVYLLRNDDLYSIFTFEFDLKSINQEFVVS